MIRRILMFVLAAAALASLLSCGSSQTKTAAFTPIQFTAQDLNFKAQQSSQWIGKQPVVINFWGTWCPPCRREIPDLVRVYDEYRPKGVEMIGLAVKDTPDQVREFSTNAKMNWVMLMSTDDILISYGATSGIPTTIFLKKDGTEAARFVGMQDYDTFKQAFESILN